MALIKCPECRRKISDSAISCPRCGYRLGAKNVCNNTENTTRNIKSKHNAWEVILSIIKLEWADDVSDFLMDIPIIGGLLAILFPIIIVLCAFAAVIAIGILVFSGLHSIHPFVAIAAGAIGLNVIAYYASYVWGARKKWFFWVCLALTILGPIILLGLA